MTRKQLLALFVCLTYPAGAWATGSDCRAKGEVCQDKLVYPPSLGTSQPSPQPQDPNASALAPMQPPDNSTLVKNGPESKHALTKNHDNDLFASPNKKEALTDPFGPESGQPLVGTPQNP